MNKPVINKPQIVKSIYQKKERLWLAVDKIGGNYISGTVHNTPLSKCSNCKDKEYSNKYST